MIQKRNPTVSDDTRTARDIQDTVNKEELRVLVSEVLELPVREVTDDADFIEELGLYSLLAMEIVMRLEDRYGIVVEEAERAEITSLNKVYDLLTKKRRSAPPQNE